ncbi:Sir2 family NAD-dependent protein deacetylase [Niveibacterium sp. SC-1]|uniref:SIR2 family NAD-dependent protein deacylase n=1 Tax=Niveibacterium sp. SC-1 TaxID=3135646 RepID=UPI00311DD68C
MRLITRLLARWRHNGRGPVDARRTSKLYIAPEVLESAAKLIREADGLFICAGAGMGVDSGLPDFRGAAGLWRDYPAFAQTGLSLERFATGAAFVERPRMAWGLMGHLIDLFRKAPPHAGYAILNEWAKAAPCGAFVFTSNVDDHFQRAGFPENRIVECHGSLFHLQCANHCGQPIWSGRTLEVPTSQGEAEWQGPLPTCPACGGLARPNVLLFGDYGWNPDRTENQSTALTAWMRQIHRAVVIEIGVGTAIPSVRVFASGLEHPLIRINPEATPALRPDDLRLQVGALEGLTAIDSLIRRSPR